MIGAKIIHEINKLKTKLNQKFDMKDLALQNGSFV